MCKGREARPQPQIIPDKVEVPKSIVIKKRQKKKYKKIFSEVIIVSLLTLHNISHIISEIHSLSQNLESKIIVIHGFEEEKKSFKSRQKEQSNYCFLLSLTPSIFFLSN